jgi:hypothetical protein
MLLRFRNLAEFYAEQNKRGEYTVYIDTVEYQVIFKFDKIYALNNLHISAYELCCRAAIHKYWRQDVVSKNEYIASNYKIKFLLDSL